MQPLHAVGKPVEAATAAASPVPAATAPYAVEAGLPSPLGPSPGTAAKPGANFAVYAPNAEAVSLCLYDWDNQPLMEVPMQRSADGAVWHLFVAGLPQVSCWDGLTVMLVCRSAGCMPCGLLLRW